jgi:hypothetical protein
MFKIAVQTRRILPLLVVSSMFLVAGCGKASGTVSGHVTYQGKALDHGSVTLLPADGPGVSGEISADGTYQLLNCPLGKGKVIVFSPDTKMTEDTKKAIQAMREHPDAGGQTNNPLKNIDPSKYHNLPAEFSDPEKTKIQIDVKAGQNPFDITL